MGVGREGQKFEAVRCPVATEQLPRDANQALAGRQWADAGVAGCRCPPLELFMTPFAGRPPCSPRYVFTQLARIGRLPSTSSKHVQLRHCETLHALPGCGQGALLVGLQEGRRIGKVNARGSGGWNLACS